MVKNDKWIIEMSTKYMMINPFSPNQICNNRISFGTSSYGYDVRLSNEFMIMKDNKSNILDPKIISERLFERILVNEFINIPSHTFILGRTLEYIKVPRNIITIAFGKSTYARCGIIINITPFEPEWQGYATISITNMLSIPVKIYINEGIAQILFLEAENICKISYADRKGKYQYQDNINMAKI
ncbi:MAG: dCTP deaminase [Endomicrobium sp.]|jgi:dCTP deaminase|nr:dCTP deaminase [Endomicrobium sp.]